MRYMSLFTSALRWLLVASFLSAGLAMAQQEPTMNQIYAAAQSGKLDQAQVMVQQVLVAHPKSAKAHFVQSELYARQGNLPKAREALSTAQSLAPGLPFAKPEAVSALENQLAAKATAAPAHVATSNNAAPDNKPSGSWLLPALLAAGVIAAAYFIFRRKPAQTFDPNAAYAGSGLSGPQGFGSGNMQPNMQGGYGQQPLYGQTGQPGYGQPAGSGLGGRIMGGVATGLAVGAGVMAAQAIGRSLSGEHESGAKAAENSGSNNYEPIGNSNADMGGSNFGISDTGWDDAGSSDSGGGGDWDN
ncbi:hypothetical protein DIC66_01220 [Rhodoferax lacus]|uniref:Uncharacterized protein n=1 Tax=Rhodoferax lacus TaxID=2184758 RepID=A0A3E1RGP9_9BURK|nr:tetratricopeptide repeat protein [Rhodoferax lacus]RFO98538.1 hypothetical protein DIC66_01220 [Rhodoferax lacus]